MANIQTAIILRDRMSNVLQKISNVSNNTYNTMNSGANRAANANNTLNHAVNNVNNTANNYNNTINNTTNANNRAGKSFKNVGSSTEGLINGLKGIAAAYISIQMASKGIETLDKIQGWNARLKLITKDKTELDQIKTDIRAAANRSRADYGDIAGGVGRLGIIAGDKFKNNKQIVDFAETLQKSFVVGGANQSEQRAGNTQIQQAIGSGRLQGDEFRSVMENAPLLARAISIYTKKSMGELKQMSTDGMLTSEILINSMLNYKKVVDKQFNDMPMTFSGVMNKIKTEALNAFDSTASGLNKIPKLINDNLAEIGTFFRGVSKVANIFFDVIQKIYYFIVDHWDYISPILATLATTLLTLAANTAILTVAQLRFNAALYACPAVWIIAAIVGMIYLIVASWNYFMNDTISSLGALIGGIAIVFSWLWNTVVFLYDVVKGVLLVLWNVVTELVNDVSFAARSVWNFLKKMGLGIEIFWKELVLGYYETLNVFTGKFTKQIEKTKQELDGLKGKFKDLKIEAEYIEHMKYADIGFSKGYIKSGEVATTAYNIGLSIDDFAAKQKKLLDEINGMVKGNGEPTVPPVTPVPPAPVVPPFDPSMYGEGKTKKESKKLAAEEKKLQQIWQNGVNIFSIIPPIAKATTDGCVEYTRKVLAYHGIKKNNSLVTYAFNNGTVGNKDNTTKVKEGALVYFYPDNSKKLAQHMGIVYRDKNGILKVNENITPKQGKPYLSNERTLASIIKDGRKWLYVNMNYPKTATNGFVTGAKIFADAVEVFTATAEDYAEINKKFIKPLDQSIMNSAGKGNYSPVSNQVTIEIGGVTNHINGEVDANNIGAELGKGLFEAWQNSANGLSYQRQ